MSWFMIRLELAPEVEPDPKRGGKKKRAGVGVLVEQHPGDTGHYFAAAQASYDPG